MFHYDTFITYFSVSQNHTNVTSHEPLPPFQSQLRDSRHDINTGTDGGVLMGLSDLNPNSHKRYVPSSEWSLSQPQPKELRQLPAENFSSRDASDHIFNYAFLAKPLRE
ncbi:hypothetical protein AVEN_94596-1 [Araneus ventricosus]|uniref:Uncharacterized protein n=1 Tax=Araneus ventricosus TaxID=182803 RepID=A0A4Y2ILD9_ARAVE|nr:hypothetical protein AVEN_94596-1 [Araneus ventricosus]